MRKLVLILVTFALMAVCGAGSILMALMYLMDLGTKHHSNYEHYGQTSAVALIFVAGAAGFAVPGLIA